MASNNGPAFASFQLLVILLFVFLAAFACTAPTDPTSNQGTNGSLGPPSASIAAPAFSPASGALVALTEIALSSPTSGATIRYTTDGSDPTVDSPAYDGAKKPLLFFDSTWKAIAVKDGKSSTVASATFTVTPYFPDFALDLAVGMRWNYAYKHNHTVSYSYSGDRSYSTSQTFSFLLTESRNIGGIEFYRVAASGAAASKVRWNWLAWKDRRLYGSIDGSASTVLFDAMYGFWIGQCFFASNAKDGLLSAKSSADAMVISQGWQYNDNSTVYYPGIGTIYDPDPYSGYSRTTEKYKSGIGPYSWYYSHGSSSYYEASSDSYTITLANTETNVDPAPFLFDAEVPEDTVALLHLPTSSGKFRARASSTTSDLLCYVESLSGGDPVLGVYAWNNAMAPLVEGSNLRSGAAETVYIDAPGGDCMIAVSGLPEGGCDLRVCVMKVTSGTSTGPWMSSVPLANHSLLEAGSSTQASFAGGDVDLYGASLAFGKAIYAYAIPLSPELDLHIALMQPKTPGTQYSFVSSDRIRCEDDHGAGLPEALTYSKTTAITALAQVWEDADDDGLPELPGDYIFGWGNLP